VTSAGNSATIYFRTDATVNQTGFQINAKAGLTTLLFSVIQFYQLAVIFRLLNQFVEVS
jgi:hypothetical protein